MTMLRKIGSQFKKPSGFLGRIISSIMIKGNRPAIENLIKGLNIKQEEKILEIGYGPGIGIKLIAENCDSCKIVGIDFSELMFKRAAKRNKQFIQNGKVELLFGDFLEKEIVPGNFDKIYCVNVVYFWDNLQKPFEKIKALLKQGGIFSFYMAKNDDLNKMKFTKEDIFNKYSIEQVLEALKLVGFSEIDYFFDKGYFVKVKK
jgi:SAM-dependent methyltransferase